MFRLLRIVFWSREVRWWTVIHPSMQMCIWKMASFGKISFLFYNFIILYIFSTRCLKGSLSFPCFQKKLKYHFEVEQTIYAQQDKLILFLDRRSPTHCTFLCQMYVSIVLYICPCCLRKFEKRLFEIEKKKILLISVITWHITLQTTTIGWFS